MHLNHLLLGLCLLVQVFQLLLLPLFLLPRSPLWGLLLIPSAGLTLMLWALIHECIHGSLLIGAARNQRAGRLLSVLFGSPFRVLRLGHLLHHSHNRDPRDCPEFYLEQPGNRRAVAWAYYFRLFGGLYLYEVLSSVLFLLPKRWVVSAGRALAQQSNYVEIMMGLLLKPAALREVRVDSVCVIAALSISAWSYGSYAWMLALALLARGLIISIHDNVYHYGTQPGERDDVLSLRMNPMLRALVLNFNYHDVHHRHPGLGWRELPSAFKRDGGQFRAGFLVALRRQLAGPIALPRAD
jgi:fatty acid desaturase